MHVISNKYLTTQRWLTQLQYTKFVVFYHSKHIGGFILFCSYIIELLPWLHWLFLSATGCGWGLPRCYGIWYLIYVDISHLIYQWTWCPWGIFRYIPAYMRMVKHTLFWDLLICVFYFFLLHKWKGHTQTQDRQQGMPTLMCVPFYVNQSQEKG